MCTSVVIIYKSASESDKFEIRNTNPVDSDLIWLHHIPDFELSQASNT